MARRPFFSGDYGSALGSYDTAARLLAQAGQTQGAAMAGLGGDIAGAIEKYGLNKEREKKANARIKATIQGLDSYVEAGVITDAQRLQAKEMLQNPDASSSEKVAFIEQQEKQLFQLPKALLAKAQAGNAVLQNEITNRTKDFEVRSKELSNALLESQGVLAALKASGYTEEQKAALEDLRAQTEGRRVTAAKTIAETKGIPAAQEANLALERVRLLKMKQELEQMPKDAKNRDDLAKVNLALKNLDLQFKPGQLQREQTMGQLGITKEGLEVSALPGQLDREQREGEGRILAQNLATAGVAADLARDAEEYDVYSAADRAAADKEKDIATARETDARTDKLLFEVAALMEADKPIDDSMLVGVEDAAILPIDIETAAGGDAVGWLTDAANWVAGVAPIAGGTGISPERIRERTNLANLQGIVVPAFLRGISTHGGKWAREDIMRMIPQEDDTNADMRSKIKRLVPHMRKKLVEARLIYKKGTSNASVRNTALQISYQFPGIIKVLDQSIGGGGKIEEAEEILRGGQ